MSSKYLSNVPVERFMQIIPRRRGVIEKASSEFPRYEYNANILAKELHPKIQHVIISKIEDLYGAKRYTLIPDEESGTEKLAYFNAGQYISLHLRIGDSVLTRPYSLCSSPKEALDGKYQITVKTMKNGFASEYINTNFHVGTKVDISAPAGFFYYEPLRDHKNVLGIAGGSGIAPFLSLAKSIADGTNDFNLTLLYGSRTEKEILFKDELDDLEKRGCLKVIHVLSDEEKDGYQHGFITSDLIRREMQDSSVFVCGSQGMYDYILKETEKLGLPRKQVRFDAYGEYKLTDRDRQYTQIHKDKTYQLTVTIKGKTVTVPARSDETILVAFERAGLDAPSGCRSGECGWCRSKLISGEIYAPEKVERRRQYDRLAGYIHPCCSFPCSDCQISINCE
ncbi:MAG: iron-sulfur cluster-binding domain-containing protein [Oscillospiraceae bacterium]|nr:iron-sulfur cluster-binding domain-containing protein [Oscillospiraceae bacterium]